ncbi:hypothetical protein T484DRAFT_1622460, partial [Baffinella frigidus]
NPQPQTLNPQPSTLNPQPSILNPQPSTLNPQPQTLNPQPSTLNPQPSILNPQPSTLILVGRSGGICSLVSHSITVPIDVVSAPFLCGGPDVIQKEAWRFFLVQTLSSAAIVRWKICPVRATCATQRTSKGF